MIVLKILIVLGISAVILVMPCFVIASKCDDASEEKLAELQKSRAEWDKIWEEIYAFQKSLPSDLLKAEDKDRAAEDNGLYLVYGPNGEKLFVNGELSRRLFWFRMAG